MITASTQSPQSQQAIINQAISQAEKPEAKETRPSTSTPPSLTSQDSLNMYAPSKKPMENIVQLFPTSPPTTTRVTPVDPPSQEEIQWALQLEEKVKQGYQPTPQETKIYGEIAKRLQDSQSNPPSPPVVYKPFQPYVEPLNLVEAQWAKDLAQKIENGYYQPSKQELKHFMDLTEKALKEKNSEQFLQWPAHITNPPDRDELQWALSVTRDYDFGEIANPRQLRHFAQVANMALEAHLEASKPQPSVSQAELNWALDLQNRVSQGYRPTEQEVQKYEDIFNRYQQNQSPDPYPMPTYPIFPGGGYGEPTYPPIGGSGKALPTPRPPRGGVSKPYPCIMLEPHQGAKPSQPAIGFDELMRGISPVNQKAG